MQLLARSKTLQEALATSRAYVTIAEGLTEILRSFWEVWKNAISARTTHHNPSLPVIVA
jgi:hypothetical protein